MEESFGMTMEYQYNDFPIPLFKCYGLVLCSILKEVIFSSSIFKDQYRIGMWLCHLWKTPVEKTRFLFPQGGRPPCPYFLGPFTKFWLKMSWCLYVFYHFSWQAETEWAHWTSDRKVFACPKSFLCITTKSFLSVFRQSFQTVSEVSRQAINMPHCFKITSITTFVLIWHQKQLLF